MFDLLKKKISGFVDKLSGKAEKGEPAEAEEPRKEEPLPEKKVAEEAPAKEKGKPVSKKAEAAEKEKEGRKKGEKKGPPEKKKVPEEEAAEAKPEKVKKAEPKKAKEKEEAAPEKEEKKAPKEVKVEAAPAKEKEIAPPEVPREKVKAETAPPEKKRGFLEKIFGGREKGGEARGKGKAVREKPQAKKERRGEAPPAKPPEKEEEKPEKREREEPTVEKAPKAEKEKAAAEPKKEEKGAGKPETEKREEELKKKVKKSIFAAVSETIRGESEVREEEILELLEELELGMLESDVALSVAEEIKEELKGRIIGAKVKRGQTAAFVRDSLKEILIGMFRETPGFGLSERLEGEGPHKIMVVGPNGSGKTTTIAKIVNLLKKEGRSVCIAASDTFRAAAVEQLVHHGNKLGVKVIHGAYGSDPTAIAFDALSHAKANDIDVVIIDTAGRQDTNVNLINQLKKMDRVIKPELKIYVGESIAGNAMVEQISTFNTDVGLDGVVLTKLDCDPKGGTVISVSRVAKLPILYVGVGQGYGDLRKFDAEEIVGEILS